MFSIKYCQLPGNSRLNKYVQSGAYTDCFQTEVKGTVTHALFVVSFYTTLLFKLERIILKLLVSKPSSDNQAYQLAEGTTNTFAAWHVEDRCENQLLLCDFQGRTRSWLMVSPANTGESGNTQLFFGSAVVSTQNKKTGTNSTGPGFSLLLGFHRIYSVLFLCSAKSNLKAQVSTAVEN